MFEFIEIYIPNTHNGGVGGILEGLQNIRTCFSYKHFATCFGPLLLCKLFLVLWFPHNLNFMYPSHKLCSLFRTSSSGNYTSLSWSEAEVLLIPCPLFDLLVVWLNFIV